MAEKTTQQSFGGTGCRVLLPPLRPHGHVSAEMAGRNGCFNTTKNTSKSSMSSVNSQVHQPRVKGLGEGATRTERYTGWGIIPCESRPASGLREAVGDDELTSCLHEYVVFLACLRGNTCLSLGTPLLSSAGGLETVSNNWSESMCVCPGSPAAYRHLFRGSCSLFFKLFRLLYSQSQAWD